MKYLVLAVFVGDFGSQVATHSKEMDLGSKDLEAQEIIDDIVSSGLGKDNLYEVFVWKSADNSQEAPVCVAYWTLDDGFW